MRRINTFRIILLRFLMHFTKKMIDQKKYKETKDTLVWDKN